jgi:hypothetical protein
MPATTEACFVLSNCSYAWVEGAWSACSNTCGSGIRTRSVTCIRSDGALVESASCVASAKPPISEACTESSGCTYQYTDECAAGTHTCSAAATCTDTFGSFHCNCNVGFYGPGTRCSDVDECSSTYAGSSKPCAMEQSVCVNNEGSFTCACVVGTYFADGACRKCPNGTTTLSAGATSVNSCSLCASGYYGAPAGSGCAICPEGATSVAGTLQRSGCKCMPGYEAINGSCALVNADADVLLFVAEPGRTCTQFCSSIGRTCQQDLAKSEYQQIQIQAASKRSIEIMKDTQFFALAGVWDWGGARSQCIEAGADAAIILNSAEESKISALCESDMCLLGITQGWPYGSYPIWIDNTAYNGWHSLPGWGFGNDWASSLYQDAWFLTGYGSRMIPLCKRLSTVIPQNCSGGFRTSSLPYAPYISDSRICYSAENVATTSCSAVPNNAHSRLCQCSAPCKEGYYKTGSVCNKCPAYSNSLGGSSSILDCLCPQAFYMVANASSGSCYRCPASSTSARGSKSLADCSCFAGFYMNASLQCAACPTGSTSPAGSIGIDSCICPDNTYGSPKTTGCKPCPHISRSAPGSTDVTSCFCPQAFGVSKLGYTRYISSVNDTCAPEYQQWTLGVSGQSCDATCQARGRQCQVLDTNAISLSVVEELSLPRNLDLQCSQIVQELQDSGKPYPSIAESGSTCYYLGVSGGNPATCARGTAGFR